MSTDCCNGPQCCSPPIEEGEGLEHCGHLRPVGSPRCYSCIVELETEQDELEQKILRMEKDETDFYKKD